MDGYRPLREVHFIYDAWCAGGEPWTTADPEAAGFAAEELGGGWDDVFDLADWDYRLGQVPEEGWRFFVRRVAVVDLGQTDRAGGFGVPPRVKDPEE